MMIKEFDDGGMVSLCAAHKGLDDLELWSFVLLAVGIQHEVRQVGASWDIFVFPADQENAEAEIFAFEAENVDWPPVRPEPQALLKEDTSPFWLMAAMVAFYSITGPWHDKSIWFSRGAVSSEKILHSGEWWRLITGLTLHADAAHLLGNVFLGGVFLYLLARQFGGGIAALIALFSGALGNGLNIMFRHGPHLSIGFSTAVFGMVGAFCISRWFRTGVFARGLLLSLGAALGLLALLGSGGERTDFGAHLWGMFVGLFLGGACCLPFFGRYAESTRAQAISFLIFVVMIVISWYLACSL